jgi:hypothetical protein
MPRPENETASPLSKGRPSESNALVKAPENCISQPARATGPRRCPWFAEVVQRAVGPAWNGVAKIFAGTGAWNCARHAKDTCSRACTLLPPGTSPGSVKWPRIYLWVVEAGDLPTDEAIELARCLIDAGAERVFMLGDNIKPSLTMRRARGGS